MHFCMSNNARFIPTHVGNGRPGIKVKPIFAVHPHACGERAFKGMEDAIVNGSSPRMWGTVMIAERLRMMRPVHPHACGERIGGSHFR